MAYAKQAHGFSIRRGCKALCISRSYFSYKPRYRDDHEVVKILTELAAQHLTWGFKKLFNRVRNLGHTWNHKKVWRIYCAIKLNLRIKRRKRIYPGQGTSIVQPLSANQCWSLDFMHDSLSGGRKFRVLNIIDDYNREALACKAATVFPSRVVIENLDQLAAARGGYPLKIRTDNGPEFISNQFKNWAQENGIVLEHITPGKPTQNSYVERFNRTFREDVLNFYIFGSLREVDQAARDFMKVYNAERPHESLGGMSPWEFAAHRSRSGASPGSGSVSLSQQQLSS